MPVSGIFQTHAWHVGAACKWQPMTDASFSANGNFPLCEQRVIRILQCCLQSLLFLSQDPNELLPVQESRNARFLLFLIQEGKGGLLAVYMLGENIDFISSIFEISAIKTTHNENKRIFLNILMWIN